MSEGRESPGLVAGGGTARAALTELLRRHRLTAGRTLGQHFMWHEPTLARLAAAADLGPGVPVLEIGPGVGVLTRALRATGARVTAVELDRRLRTALWEVLGAGPLPPVPTPEEARGPQSEQWAGDLRLIWADAVRLSWQELASSAAGPWRLCSNLPYYITGPFLAAFLEGGLPWTTAVLVVQAEAAQRLLARPGTRTYGAFTCLVGYYAEVERLFTVSRSAFLPAPRVESVAIRLRRRTIPPCAAAPQDLRRVVRAAFGQRRKTLRNALAAGLGLEREGAEALLAVAALDGGRRAETLDLTEFGRLALAWAARDLSGAARGMW